MSKILDQSGDLSFQEMIRIAKLYEFPEFAKHAELAEVVGPDQPHQNLYADVRTPLQFPCHTKAATFVSTAFFLEKQAQISPKVRPFIAERLEKFAEYWGIKNAVKALHARHTKLNKAAEYPDSTYAIVCVMDNGEKERRYPMRNALEVKAAAEWFHSYLPEIRSQFGFLDRQTIANKILVKASEFGADINTHRDSLEKHAGKGVCVPTSAAKMIRDRVKAASRCTPEMAQSMQKLASMVEIRPTVFLDPDSMSQLANTVDQFDRTHGLLNKYSAVIPAPEDVLFSATYTRTASICDESCSLTTGAVYDRNDFSKLSATDVQDIFGDEVVRSVCSGLHVDPIKMADVAATFPRNDAIVLEQLLADKGIVPLAKDASTRLGFTFDQLKEISAL
jgi:hypothetical protein